jgi:hypothetical protein
MTTLFARFANLLPAGCIWLFPDAVVLRALELIREETLRTEAEIEALAAEMNANDNRVAELTGCLARLKAELG